jgi:hypothetical protein
MKQKWFAGYDWQSLLSRELEPPFVPDVKNAEDSSNFDAYEEDDDSTFPGKPTGWNPTGF